jgi:hypothetical protein
MNVQSVNFGLTFEKDGLQDVVERNKKELEKFRPQAIRSHDNDAKKSLRQRRSREVESVA